MLFIKHVLKSTCNPFTKKDVLWDVHPYDLTLTTCNIYDCLILF